MRTTNEVRELLRAGVIQLQEAIEHPNFPEFVLHIFACDCAERTLRREEQEGRMPPERTRSALQMKREWLVGRLEDSRLTAEASKVFALRKHFPFSAGNAVETSYFAAQLKAKQAAKETANAAIRYVTQSPKSPRTERDREKDWQRQRLAWLLEIHEWAGERLPFLLADEHLEAPPQAQLNPKSS